MDPVLEHVRRTATDDPATLGVLLIGSRSTGAARPDSDYDVVWILTDDELASRAERHVKSGRLDIAFTSPARLAEHARDPGWFTAALLGARVVVDKTGDVSRAVSAIRAAAEARARGRVAEDYDAYLNSFVRSLKAWRRGDELGGRLHASESMTALVRTLCGVLGRWPPYHDDLGRVVVELERYLTLVFADELRRVVASGDPSSQQRLEAGVEAFMSSRGFPHQWADELEPLKTWRFE